MKKTTLLLGVALGYVLGTRAGRERYEQIKASAKKVAGNPTVQSAAGRAQDAVVEQASAVAHAATDRLHSQTAMQATP